MTKTLLAKSKQFQSTLPARGATMADCSCALLLDISIHAPRTGSDNKYLDKPVLQTNFNPRSPHGERPPPKLRRCARTNISIHAPRTGSDQRRKARKSPHHISIHAPRTGSDNGLIIGTINYKISIHAPRTGSDATFLTPTLCFMPFQSTLPARGATAGRRDVFAGKHISIHAPRTGSDRCRCSWFFSS